MPAIIVEQRTFHSLGFYCGWLAGRYLAARLHHSEDALSTQLRRRLFFLFPPPSYIIIPPEESTGDFRHLLPNPFPRMIALPPETRITPLVTSAQPACRSAKWMRFIPLFSNFPNSASSTFPQSVGKYYSNAKSIYY